MRLARVASLVSVVSLAWLGESRALADEDRSATSFSRAMELAARGDCEHAIPLYLDSHAAEPSVGALLGVAECLERTSHFREALARYDEARALAHDKGDEREAEIRQAHEALRARAPRLVLLVPAPEPDGLVIELDQAPIAPADRAAGLLVDPGAHVLVVTAPGRAARRETLSTPIGLTTQYPVALPPADVEAMAKAAPRTPVQQKVGVGVAIAGGFGLVLGGALLFMSSLKRSDIETRCPGGVCDAAQKSEADRLDNAATEETTWGIVALSAGAAALGTGLVLYFTAPTPGATVSLRADARGVSIGARW